MKHLHVSVREREPAVAFYSAMFNAAPSMVKADCAKRMLEDTRMNLAICSRARATGIQHVGIQVDSTDELGELATRPKQFGSITIDQEATTCCYAKSDKSRVTAPADVRWETFFTHGRSTAYGEDGIMPVAAAPRAACC